MNPRRTIVLFVVAVVVVALYVFVEHPREERSQRALETSERLAEFDPNRIDGIRIDRGDSTITLAIRGTHWELISPLEDVADVAAVQRLVREVAEAKVARDIGPVTDPSRYGLDHPVTLAFVAGTDTLSRLLVGGETVDRSYAYARRGGRPDVLLVPTGVRRYALPAIEDFRDKHVVEFDIGVVTEFTETRPGGAMRWFRSQGGWRTVVGADTIRGDAISVEGILRRLRAMRARAFLPAGAAAAALAAAPRSVHLVKRPPDPPVTVRVAALDDGRVVATASDRHRVVEVDSSALDAFAPGLSQLRDLAVFHLGDQRPARLELVSGDLIVTLVRRGREWGFPNPSLGTVESARVEHIVRAIAGLRYRRIEFEHPPTPPKNALPPTFHLVVGTTGGTMIDEMTAWLSTTRGEQRATSRSSRVTGLVDQSAIESLVAQFNRVRHGE